MKDNRIILISHIVETCFKVFEQGLSDDILTEYLLVLFKKTKVKYYKNEQYSLISFQIDKYSRIMINTKLLEISIKNRCVIPVVDCGLNIKEIIEKLYINVLRNEYDSNVWE